MTQEEQIREQILKEYARDVRTNSQILKWIIIGLCTVLSLIIVGLVILELHHQSMMMSVANHASDKMVELMSQYEWQTEYEIESTGNELMSGNIHVER